jgi:predicted house-cleaning noncanonical NTP pyrophosphatase (MazG superfamily)
MKKYKFEKLIRNNLPTRMEAEGITVNSRTLEHADYLLELKKKILEEAKEVSEANSKEELTTELADVMEVIEAIAAANQISLEEITNSKVKKREINGYFLPENYINYIEVAEDNYKVIEYLENKNRHYQLILDDV